MNEWEGDKYLNDFIKKFSSNCQLQNDVEMRVRLHDVLHSNDRRMIHSSQDFYLVQRDIGGTALRQDHLLADDLYGNWVSAKQKL